MITDRKFVKVMDVARALGVSRGKVYQMIEAGELPAMRLGALVRIPAQSVEDLIEKSMVGV